MYIVNTVKSVILHGNAFVYMKSRNADLKMCQMHEKLMFCFLKLVIIIKYRLFNFYKGSTYPTHIENSGVEMKILSSFTNLRLK